MSLGSESKAVEEQQTLAGEVKPVSAATTKANAAFLEAEQKRKRQALELQRERILSERTSSPTAAPPSPTPWPTSRRS